MKKVTFFAAIAMIAFTSNAVAQSTASATASTTASVITPITIVNAGDMNFGNLVATVAGGSIVLTPAGARTGDAAILLGADGTVTAAHFTVTGEVGYAYTITLPTTFTVLHTDALTTMTVSPFTSDPSGATGSLATGTETVNVGATIEMVANQKAGVYTNAADLAVTVFYN